MAQTWTGSINTDWNTPGNWSGGAVPSATGDVTIPDVANDPTIMAGTMAVAQSVTVQNDAVLTVAASGTLTVNGAAVQGILNQGRIENGGVIHVGSTSGVGPVGIDNQSLFNNNAGGQVNVDRTTDTGFLNSNGTVTNQGVITVGALANVGFAAVKNSAVFNNNTGGQINIHRANVIGLYCISPGIFTNNATITIGITASVGNYGMVSGGTFMNTPSGLIKIDRSGLTGLASNDSGTFTNQGTITIGATNSVGIDGLQVYNGALFLNKSGGIVHIDRSTENGVANSGVGTFTNEGTVNIGANNSPGLVGLGNYGFGTFNNSTGGIININQSTDAGLKNETIFSFNNQGTINIGSSHSVGFSGIYNNAVFNNNTGGQINIHRANVIGLYCLSPGIFTNNATITIGITASVGNYGMVSGGTFMNTPSGLIKIDRSQLTGLASNDSGTFTNQGTITIGATNSVGIDGLQVYNGALFLNKSGGVVHIDRSTENGLANSGVGTFTNEGIVNIGANNSPGLVGLGNYGFGTFNNSTGGIININQSTDAGLKNESIFSFNNQGTINIGSSHSVGFSGIYNNAVFNNNTGGQINIHRANIFGLNNESAGTFTNNATITIGITSTVGNYGLLSGGTFTNTPSGLIKIDRSQLTGLASNQSGTFTNQGTITIGATNSVGKDGLQVYNGALFLNKPGGVVHIDRSTENGVKNFGVGTFTNEGTVNIGANNSPGLVGLGNYSFGTFNNNIGGQININRSTEAGIRNLTTYSCKNQGIITLGAISGVGSVAIDNQSTFENSHCEARINIISNSVITNTGTFTNAGGIIENASGNSSITNNTGVIQNLNGGTFTTAGNPPVTTPGPINACCVAPAFTSCPANISTSTQANLCLAAVAYTPVVSGNPAPSLTYNFTGATTGTGSGTGSGSNFNRGITNVTVTATSNCGTAVCSFTVTVTDNIKPVVVCKPYTAALNAAGQAAVTPANVFQSGTDNCGVVNLVSVSPNALNCANIGATSVTLTVNDGNGNTGTCTATVTVTDPIAPTMLCKNATLLLNAQGQATLTTAQVNNGSFDNCSIASLTLSQTAFTCANVGNNIVTLTGTDPANNQAKCNATVTVTDPILPVALCKNATINLDGNGNAPVNPVAVNNGSSDNCSFNLSVTPAVLTCANIGVNTVTLKATDQSGNTATCTARVTIKDVSGPVAKCKNPTVYLNSTGQGTLSVAEVNNGSTDNCGISGMSINQTSFNCSELLGSPWPVVLSMVDVNGNTSSCTASVSVSDAIAPTAICEDQTVTLGANGKVVVLGEDVAFNSIDNCSVWSYSPVAKVYTTANIGPNNLSVTVKDWSGNPATCTAVITVLPFTGFQSGGGSEMQSVDIEPSELLIYPNPTSGGITMIFELPADQSWSCRVFDTAGRMVMRKTGSGITGENIVQMELDGLSSGVYMVDFQSDKQSVQQRLVVQR